MRTIVAEIRFCYWHIKTKDNPDGTDCSAHLAEGRCYKCRYTIKNLQHNSKGELYISSRENSELKGACQDFKPSRGLMRLLQNEIEDIQKVLDLIGKK